jgi:hypothetical protein
MKVAEKEGFELNYLNQYFLTRIVVGVILPNISFLPLHGALNLLHSVD